jgi:hypothetical protein
MAELELGSRLNKVPDGSINELNAQTVTEPSAPAAPRGCETVARDSTRFSLMISTITCVVYVLDTHKYDLACTVGSGTTIRSKIIAKELNISCKHLYINLFLRDVHTNRP